MSDHIRIAGGVTQAPTRASQFLTDFRRDMRRRRSAADQDHPVFDGPLDYVCREENLAGAFDHCEHEGGHGPGENGLGYDHYGPRKWDLIRELQQQIRSGEYDPGPEKPVQIPKGDGRVRSLVLENIPARVVQRAVAQILEPIMDPEFCGLSFGGRTGYGTQHALALVEYLIDQTQASSVIKEDLQTAYDVVTPESALAALPRSLGDPDLQNLLARMTASRLTKGLRQGAATSSHLLNAFLERNLDRPWSDKYPDVPMIRYADDLFLVIPRSRAGDELKLYNELKRLVASAGMRLKGSPQTAIQELKPGNSIDWLGVGFQRQNDRLRFELSRDRKESLIQAIADCHFELLPQARARRVLVATINQLGPAYSPALARQFIDEVLSAAAVLGFQELCSAATLENKWGTQHLKWLRLREETPAWFARRRYKKGFTLKSFPSLKADGMWRSRG